MNKLSNVPQNGLLNRIINGIIDTVNNLISNSVTVVKLTQAEYDALAVKDDNVLYIITDAE